jgi:hypothetical protein
VDKRVRAWLPRPQWAAVVGDRSFPEVEPAVSDAVVRGRFGLRLEALSPAS